MQLFLSVTISPLPIPESTSSLHPNSNKIIERIAFGDEAAGCACRPLKMAGHSIELASPVRVQSSEIAIPIERSTVLTPDSMSTFSSKGSMSPITNADAQIGAAVVAHCPFPRPRTQAVRASRVKECISLSVLSIKSS